MDSITIREIPPLRAAWAPIGEQAQVPIVGTHHKRVLSAVMNILTGSYAGYVSPTFNQTHFQEVLRRTRAKWRGWRIVLFADKNSAHRAAPSQTLATALGIEIRWLPTACPELNVIDCLWRHIRDEVLANEPTPDLETTVITALTYLESLSGQDRLRKAGVFSPDFWLAAVRASLLSKSFCGPT